MLSARTLYTGLWWLALPLVPLRLWWRGRREPGYREHIGERFGRYREAAPSPQETYWIHAVSVGETRAAAPLVERMLRERPRARIVLTTMTATGRETGRALFGDRVVQAWLPYDLPFAVRAFLAHFRPDAGLLVETELWPNLVAECASAGVPLFLVNARLSERSAAGYARAAPLTQPMLASLAGIAAQTDADAARLTALGARDVAVTGNVKFDVAIPAAQRALGATLRAKFGGGQRRVFIAASTRDGEEALLLDALARAPLPDDVLTLIVPRHPQRFDEVGAMLRERSLRFARRTDDRPAPADVRWILGDSMGEMIAYYAASDVAFVGGSLLPLGGQNLIEPIALGTPTLVGPHTFNFAEASAQAVAAGAAIRVDDADALIARVRELFADDAARERMRAAAAAFIDRHRGAADRTWRWLAPRLPARVSPAGGG